MKQCSVTLATKLPSPKLQNVIRFSTSALAPALLLPQSNFWLQCQYHINNFIPLLAAIFPAIYTDRDIFISQFYILKLSLHSRTFLLPFYYTFIVNNLTFLALTATVNVCPPVRVGFGFSVGICSVSEENTFQV